MHQPDYRGSDGVMKMPWVFLHAIKDYYEMPWLLSKHKSLKATFNITAPLIEQLNLYSDPLKNDSFLSLWNLHPSHLDSQSKTWIIKICKSTQYDTMVKPIERFNELYHKKSLSEDELIDLETLFMLAWCGNYLREENDVIRSLFAKGKNFTQSDKSTLLATLVDFVQTILPFYASLQEKGVISISTTPYNHPILPLLLDAENIIIANPHGKIPNNPLSLRDDAIEQVERSISLYEETFGCKPSGFWPAEGAVDEKSIAIYKDHGIKWIATDEAILFKSLQSDDRTKLYQPYKHNSVVMGFRDHGLSDLIGFTYRFKTPHDAAEHFIRSIEPIASAEGNPTVFVILDGENAWEFFENNGYDFFMTLYGRLDTTEWCNTVSMGEVSNMRSISKLERVAPGSWINGNFCTWSSNVEKNRAWELIYQTRRDVDNFHADIEDEVSKKVKFHFLAAECSDWFWWYGDDHMTEFAYEFDELFREHLITIYRLLKIQPPSDLFIPIITRKSSASFLLKPKTSITPIVDGIGNSFFEWVGSGSVDESKLYSTMDRSRGPISKIYYGHNTEHVFLAFVGDVESLDRSGLKLLITFEESAAQYEFNMDQPYKDKDTHIVIGERIEISLSRAYFENLSSVHLRFEILRDDQIVQTMPGFGSLLIDLDETYVENWFI
jgi:alpha-amylase/alpha-mannosidase (GH57 family)